MHCPNCGARNEDRAQFCIKCGKRLVHVTPPKPKTRGPRISLAGGLLVGLLVVTLSAGVAYYLPRPYLGPPALGEATPGAPSVTSHGITDREGKVIVVDSRGSEQAIIQVEDEDSRLPVFGIEVYFMQQGSSYLVLAIDPQGRYLAGWSEGFAEERSSPSSSFTTVGFLIPASPAYAQPLPLILLFLKAVSKVPSFRDLIAYLQDPPDLAYWGVLYHDTCWSGEELANYVGSVGLILPGIDDVAGVLLGEMDEIARAIFFLSQHVMEEDAKEYLMGLDRPVRIRTYHLGIPALGMVPVGWCEPEATPTPILPTPTPISPTPTLGRPEDWIAFASDRDGDLEIYTMKVDGSNLRKLTNNSDDEGPSWSPDGSRMVFHSFRDGYQQIYVMNSDGSGQTHLLSSEYRDQWAFWSPDGREIAFARGAGHNADGWYRTEVFVMNSDGTNVKRLTFSSDHTGEYAHMAWPSGWSPDGSQILFYWYVDGYDQLFIMNRDGTGLRKLTSDTYWNAIPTMSPDGRRIAFSSSRDGNYEIYVMNADGTSQTRLTFSPEEDWMPRWSEDGSRIIFESRRDGRVQIYSMSPDGTDQVRLSDNTANDHQPDFRPDSSRRSTP